MKLFSKRNTRIYRESRLNDDRFSRINGRELISEEVRNRLISEIKFITSSDDFLDYWIFFKNEKKDLLYLDKDKIDQFSLAELGSRMSDHFEFEKFDIKKQKHTSRFSEKEGTYFDDYKLFDLIEIIFLFSKEVKRFEVINRFNSIFQEEGVNFEVIEHLITRKSGETIKSLISLLKDKNLGSKLKSYYQFYENEDFVNSAKLSADILNIVFSDFIKDNKKKKINELQNKIALKIVSGGSNAKDKRKRFVGYLNNLSNLSKDLSNDIYDVRHTENSTIEIRNQNIYKLISNQNMSIIELVLTSLKDDYVLGDNWEMIKNDYVKKYKIDTTTRYVIPKSKENSFSDEDDINPEDIPF